jgi:hypothetical protein
MISFLASNLAVVVSTLLPNAVTFAKSKVKINQVHTFKENYRKPTTSSDQINQKSLHEVNTMQHLKS